MPRIKVKGIKVEDVCKVSKKLIDELEALLECPRDYFSLEHINGTFIKDGEIVEGYPFIEVAWFDRGQEIQDKVAKTITKFFNSVGYDNLDIIFIMLKKESYYENGEHF